MNLNSSGSDLIEETQNRANHGMRLVMESCTIGGTVPKEIVDITIFVKTLVFSNAIENGIKVPMPVRMAIEKSIITAFFLGLGQKEKNRMEGFTE